MPCEHNTVLPACDECVKDALRSALEVITKHETCWCNPFRLGRCNYCKTIKKINAALGDDHAQT